MGHPGFIPDVATDYVYAAWSEEFGAIGAIVMADTRRLEDCFPALDYFESCELPYVVAVNHFEGTPAYEPADVRDALSVPERVEEIWSHLSDHPGRRVTFSERPKTAAAVPR